MKRLSKQQIIKLHDLLIAQSGGEPGIRDEGLLESAINAPFQSFGGAEFYPTLLEKAARLGYGLMKNHSFLDGNKRIGTHVMLVFLAINNITLKYDDTDLISTVLDIAAGQLEQQDLLLWIQEHVDI